MTPDTHNIKEAPSNFEFLIKGTSIVVGFLDSNDTFMPFFLIVLLFCKKRISDRLIFCSLGVVISSLDFFKPSSLISPEHIFGCFKYSLLLLSLFFKYCFIALERPRACAEEHVLELIHTGVGEQQSRIVVRHDAAARHGGVAVLLHEEVDELLADLIGAAHVLVP